MDIKRLPYRCVSKWAQHYREYDMYVWVWYGVVRERYRGD